MVHIKQMEMGSIGTNCYILTDDSNHCVVIDCDGIEVIDYLEENKLKPDYIFLTHGHFDHIGAVEAVKQKYGCSVCAGENETRVLLDPKINHSNFGQNKISLQPEKLFKDGEIFQVGDMTFQILFTPGHTEGSICYIIENNIISGDTLFLGSCGRTDLATGNWDTILLSLQKLKSLKGDYIVYPGHGPDTTLENERRHNPYM